MKKQINCGFIFSQPSNQNKWLNLFWVQSKLSHFCDQWIFSAVHFMHFLRLRWNHPFLVSLHQHPTSFCATSWKTHKNLKTYFCKAIWNNLDKVVWVWKIKCSLKNFLCPAIEQIWKEFALLAQTVKWGLKNKTTNFQTFLLEKYFFRFWGKGKHW